MKFGFLIVCFLRESFENFVVWVKSIGFEMLEVVCWFVKNIRDYFGIILDVVNFIEE